MTSKNEFSLSDLKKEYVKFQKKYFKLPDFKILNQDFGIESIAGSETDLLIREIRKHIVDKILTYLRFTEMFLNPQNTPIFFLNLAKGLNQEDKKCLYHIYDKLGKLEIEVLEIDNEYSEKAEVEFIVKATKEWQTIKKEMNRLVESFKRSWSQKAGKKDKNYFG